MIWQKELRRELEEAKARIDSLEDEKQKLLDRILEMSGQRPLYSEGPMLPVYPDITPIQLVPEKVEDAPAKPARPEAHVLTAIEVIERAHLSREKRRGKA